MLTTTSGRGVTLAGIILLYSCSHCKLFSDACTKIHAMSILTSYAWHAKIVCPWGR